MFKIFNFNSTKKIIKGFETLDDVRAYLDQIPNINYGGCAISAYAMYLWLEKNNQLNNDTTIVYGYSFDHDGDEVSELENNVKNHNFNEDSINSCSHAMLFHNGKYYDSSRVVDDFKNEFDFSLLYFIPKEVLKKFMYFSLQEGRGFKWNTAFKRKYNVPLIENNLDIKIFEAAYAI